jgi:hypothetical protein
VRHKSTCGGRSGRGRRCRFAAQDFEHHRAASRAFALDRLAPVFHGFLDAIGNFPLGLAFDAISFSHKYYAAQHFMRRTADGAYRKPSGKATLKKNVMQFAMVKFIINLFLQNHKIKPATIVTQKPGRKPAGKQFKIALRRNFSSCWRFGIE